MFPKQAPRVGCRVMVTDGSSDGHTGICITIKSTCIRIKRDADGIEVDVSNYYILAQY